MPEGQVVSLNREHFVGALVGLAVGDAVGTAVEFAPPGSFPPVTDMVGGGPFSLPAGAWTDDTSMALCLAESLVEKAGFDSIDQLQRYVAWYRTGHLSSTGKFFDIGNATRAALQRFERTGESFPGDAQPTAAGNGALMRLAPLTLAYADAPATAVTLAAEMARSTHGAPQAADANRYFAGLLVGALRGENVSQLLYNGVYEPVPGVWDDAPLHPEVLDVAQGSFLVKEPPAIRGDGYVVRAMEAALWALRSTRTFQDGVLAAVNLGDDADTTAAIFGQLAGAVYGVDAIPTHWRKKLLMHDLIEEYAYKLHMLADGGRKHRGPMGNSTPAPTTPPIASMALPGDSFWVVPGRILAGPYPGAPHKRDAAEKLNAFLDVGVTSFIDLTEEDEGLQPYQQLLNKLAAQRGISVTHLRMPIQDVSIPTSEQMHAILGTLRKAVADGKVVYVHCWGGVGRTGTALACLLVEDGLGAQLALQKLKQLRRHTSRAHRWSPETAEQRAYVAAWPRTARSRPTSVQRQNPPRLSLIGPETLATGAEVDGGFLVYSGSKGRLEHVASLQTHLQQLRSELLADGSFLAEGKSIRLTRDHLFSSSSQAAGALTGGPVSGRTAWRDPAGRSLKELQTTAIASAVGPPFPTVVTSDPSHATRRHASSR